MPVVQVQAYQASDGSLFMDLSQAEAHEQFLTLKSQIQSFLTQGSYQSLPLAEKQRLGKAIADWEKFQRSLP